ncbi:MAG TPA: D-alanyl-D-alanine carboxypeptidase family protein [Burkholderiales bacterium]|nr:D-alanyl-D-alanine carboxypeptidase [Betaproteobacteria bacterium]HQR51664.1 D-alanyl-D-alanine carboxypeptidase family protein [Burkholderiales bacterium]
MKSLLALLLSLFVTAAAAQQTSLPVPPPPTVAAKSWVLYDFLARQVIASQNPNERIEPASLTKMMTAYLTYEAIKQKRVALDQVVPVSPRAWKAQGSRMFIEPNRPVTVEELIHGMVIQSGNDACIALAEAIAGSEEVFAQMMNQQAQKLGMKNTSFVNSTGLPDPKHYTTAYDMALLAAALIRDFPEHYKLNSQREFRYNNITQANRNRLLWTDPYVDGVKTGHHEAAGYCLVASAKRDSRRLISVVTGTASEAARATESQKVLNYGFQFYDTVKVYAKDQTVATIRVWKGAENDVRIGFVEDFYLALPKGDAAKLRASMETHQPLMAPLAFGQEVGTLKLALEEKPLGEYPLVALSNVPVAGLFGRTVDMVRLWLPQ